MPQSLPPRLILPPHAPGLRIGLLGGSFNPPHAAHRAISLFALKRLGLDRVWWLVTPGNPLKDVNALSPLPARIAAAQRIAHHPRIDVTGLEAVIHTRYTIDTLDWLTRRFPLVHFVWIMGADNLRQFHRWENWRGIAARIPIAVIDRGGVGPAALAGPAAGARPQPGPRKHGTARASVTGTGVDLFARPEVHPVLHRPSRPGRNRGWLKPFIRGVS